MLHGKGRIVLLALVLTLALAAGTVQSGEESFKETFEATAMVMGTSNPPILPSGVRTIVQINITRWSSDKERQNLLTELRENGQRGLNRMLSKQEETGWLRVVGRGAASTSRPREVLRYARQIDTGDGARRIVLALDRAITFQESAGNEVRTRQFDVTLIVMDVDKKGEGEGQLAMGVRLELDDQNNLKVKNFGTEPVRLMNLRKR